MPMLGLIALACASGVIVLFAPNVVALGGVTVAGLLAIIVFCMRNSHTLLETLVSIGLFLTLFQATFMVANLMLGGRTRRQPAKKPGRPPFA